METTCVVNSDVIRCATSERSVTTTEEATREIKQEQKKIRQAKPLCPASLKVTHLTATTASIEWELPYDDGGSKITNYILEKKESGSTDWETLTSLPPAVMDCELESMVAGKDYYIRIRAENKYGVGDAMELSTPIRVRGIEKATPSKPGTPEIVRVGEDQVTITWDIPLSDGGCPVTHYVLERREVRGPQWIRMHKTAVQGPPYTIQNLNEGTEYEFRVFAKNVMGFSEPSELSKTVATNQPDVEPPIFDLEMVDVAVEEGERAFFDVRVTGLPDPEVRWFKNYREVFDGFKHRLLKDGEKLSLVINNVGAEDCGDVECRAYNKAGTATNRARLSLRLPAKLKMSPLLQEGMAVQRGDKIRVRVPITGCPSPKITWIKDGEVLEQNVRFEMTVSDNCATLLIHDTEKTDGGKYELRVENDYGSDSAGFLVTITDHPDPPQGKPEVCDVDQDSCRIKWCAPAHDGGAEVTSYLIEKCEGTGSNWIKAGGTTGNMFSMLVRKLKENREYRFRVRAENVHGLSEPGEESDRVFTQEPKLDIDYDRLVIQDNVYTRVNPEKLSTDLHGKYIVCEELGRGAFGVVHRVIERKTGKSWAAKFLRCTAVERPMLRQEMEIMNTLHHPKLLKLHEAFDMPGETVMILELLSGGDLFEKLTEPDGVTTEEMCISYMRQICQGVSQMHKNNIVHLDLKPENIVFVTKSSKSLKIVDFGLAQIVDPERLIRVAFGTAEFCAPEVMAHGSVSFCSDMWSLGVLAYVMLVGYSPFAGKSAEETYRKVLTASYNFDETAWTKISESAKTFISSLVLVDKKKRMTISQALAHPWLNGEAEAVLSGATITVGPHRKRLLAQQWRKTHSKTCLAIGHLAYTSPIFYKMNPKGVVFERELNMDVPDSAPQVVVELNSCESYEGTLGRFKCKFQGQPSPTVQWYFEGEEISERGGKYSFWYKRGVAMMSVNRVHPDDAGTYMCVATNTVGTCSTLGELHVQALRRRRSLDLGRRRRSMSYDRDLSGGLGRSSSVDRFSSCLRSLDANIPPQFKLPLLDQSQASGKPCVLSVRVTCKPEPELAWFHDNRRVTSCDGLTIKHAEGWSSLAIDALHPLDAGEWRVLAINAYGQAMTVCRLTVLENIPANFYAPVFTSPVCKSVVFEGNTTMFTCRVAGFPQPEIFWLKDRRPLADDFRFETFVDENEAHSLVINEAYAEDSGHYSCVAVNPAGTAATEAELVVECLDYDSIYEISRSQRSNASMVSDLESVYTRSSVPSSAERKARQRKLDIAPQFTSALRPKRISEGSTVRFNCSVTALPMPDVTWLRGNSALNEGGRIHMSNNFGLLSLEISEVRREDAGVYTVRIKNKEGEAVCNATLEVEEIGKEEEKLDGPRKPWFILEAQNQWCEVGQRATFEAQATGKPIPSFKWLRDNCPLAADGRIKMYSDEQGNAKLVVSDLRHGDNGLYFCVAESKAGKAKCAATLKVVDKGQLGDRRRSGSRSRDVTPMRSRRSMSRDSTPLGRRFIGSRESTPTGLKEIDTKLTGTAPWFLQTLTDRLEVHEGDPIDLKVIVDGDPKPRVTWLKEPYRELMYSRRHRVVTAGDHHVMVIASSISTDAGRFIVIAENDLGRIQSSCWVNMLPPRVVEGEDYDIKRSFVEMPEYEYELHASKEKGKMAPRFVKKLPVSKEVREGDDIRVECKIDEADAGDVISSIDVTTKVVKEGAIKTLTLEKSGEITVSRDVFADRDRTPTGDEESAAVEKGVAKETVEKAEADATMVVAGVATEAGATMTVAGVAAAAAGESDTVVVQEQMQQSQTVVIEAVPLEVSQSEKDKQRTADVNAIKAVTAEGDAVVEENIEPCLADRPQKAPKPAAETERQEDDDLEEVDLGVKVVEATPEKLAREASPPAIEEETIKPTQKEGEQGSIEAKVSAVLASKPEGEAMTVAGIAPPDKSQSDAVGTATKVEAVIHDSEVQGKVSEEPSQIATDVSLKETVQSVAEKSEVASSESKQEVTGSKLEVTESKTSSEVTFVSSEKSTEISQKVKGTYTSKQKLQLLGSSSEERSDSPPAGSSVKIKTKTRNGDASMTISKSDENHVTVAAVTLDQGASPERGQMRRMSSKELFLVRPSTIQVEPVVMTVAGIAPVAQSGEEQQQISQSYEKEINVVVQSEVAESHLSSEVPSPNAGRKGESRAESVISEDPTESSWTEYTSEATLTESEIDADVDDVIAVKKVTKVTRVVEATQDGGEKIVSKVTEVTTNVTEGGQTKVTCERQEETAAIASSDEESSSDESSSDESSDSESDAESTGSTVEIGKGNAVSAAVDSLQEGGDKDTCSSKSSSSDEETEVEIEMNVELKIDEGKIKESKEESREKTDEVIAESEESGSSEDSDSDSDTSSEEE